MDAIQRRWYKRSCWLFNVSMVSIRGGIIHDSYKTFSTGLCHCHRRQNVPFLNGSIELIQTGSDVSIRDESMEIETDHDL
jgi:hypothetical protein